MFDHHHRTGIDHLRPATTTACNGLEKLLNMCPTTTTAPPTTTTTIPPTTTTTTSGQGGCQATAPPVSPPSGTWACTFDDEFNGTSLNPAYWQPQLTSESDYTTGASPHEVCYVNNPSTISESGGTLDLSVVQVANSPCDGIGGSPFFSSDIEGGEVMSYQLFSQEYGYFQVSAEMPASVVDGLQDSLWLYPEDETKYGPWPDSGEIDYGELYSEYPTRTSPWSTTRVRATTPTAPMTTA